MASGKSKTLYQLLGVKRSADEAAIKRAFYRKAKRYHPDTNHEDPHSTQERFVAIVAAYETLLDRDKRAAYDVELGARSETLQDTLRRARMRREARAREADSARDEGAETGDPLADFVQSFRYRGHRGAVMRRGLAALESLEEEFQDAMHAAYHGPEYVGGAAQFPYFFELEERASPLFGDDLLHMVSGRQLLGTVDHVRPSLLEGADMPPRCYLAPPGEEAADLPHSAAAWHGVPEEEDEVDAALEAEAEGAARAREAGALRMEADGSVSLDDDGSAASRRALEQRRLGLSGPATGHGADAGAGEEDPDPSWRERLASFGRPPLPGAHPLRTARMVDAETAREESRQRVEETRGERRASPPPPHHTFQVLKLQYQGRTVATGYRTRTTLPPPPGLLGSLRGGAEVGLIYIYGEPGLHGEQESGSGQGASTEADGEGSADRDTSGEEDEEEYDGEEDEGNGPAAWARGVVTEVGGVGVRADLSTAAAEGAGANTGGGSGSRESEWARAWEVVRSGVNPYFPISERGAQPLEPTARARPAMSVSGREPGTDVRGFYGGRLARDAAEEGAPAEDPGIAARELDSNRTLLACVRGRGELVSGNFLRRVFNGDGVQTHSLLAWRSPGVRFSAWLQGDGLREAKVSRTSHAASRYWLFEPRAQTHDRGSWYIETNPAARVRRERHCLHPAVYVLTTAFDSLDLERKDQRRARRREGWASRFTRWFR